MNLSLHFDSYILRGYLACQEVDSSVTIDKVVIEWGYNVTMVKNWKYRLPSYFQVKKFKFDIHVLQSEVRTLENQFKNVIQSNRELCTNNHELVQTVYDHYEQVSLTTLAHETDRILSPELCFKMGETAGSTEPLSKHQKYRLKLQHRVDHPELDERNYNHETPIYKGSYIQKCVEQFNAQVMRVRLVKLKAGRCVDWHIDYDPSFATRLIVPIYTNPEVINKTKRSNQIESVHLPADGHAWFLNTGFSHSVENNGNTDRTVLMFSLMATNLLAEISNEWKLKSTESLNDKNI